MELHQTLLTVLLVLLSLPPVKAQYTNEPDHFFCGFDSEEEFEKWTVIDKNGPMQNNNYYWWTEEEGGSVFFAPGSSSSGDDWLISPEVELSAGKNYVVRVLMWCDWATNLTFAMGNSPTEEGMSLTLAEQQDYAGYYYLCFPVPEITESGGYYFGVYNQTKPWMGVLHLQSFEVVEDSGLKTVSVTLLSQEDSTPIKGGAVTLQGAYYEPNELISDDQGMVLFEYLSPGSYSLNIEAKGRQPISDISVIVTADQNVEITQRLDKLPECTISGKVINTKGLPISQAIVNIMGERHYQATTDDSGAFRIEQVVAKKDYKLSITKPHYKRHSTDIVPPEGNLDLGDIVLQDLEATPAFVQAEIVSLGALLSWMIPINDADFQLDEGTYRGSYVFSNNEDYALVGNRFSEPIQVNQISWVLTDAAGDNKEVDVWIFALDESGTPTDKVLYEARNVDNVNYTGDGMVWNYYTLPEPIQAPYGCMIALGHQKSIAVGSDYQDWGDSFATRDLSSGWGLVENVGTFLIRATGVQFAGLNSAESRHQTLRSSLQIQSPKSSQLVDESLLFSVYRLLETDKGNQSKWQLLTEQAHEFSLLDSKLKSQAQGVYLYAVISRRSDGVVSSPSFSNSLDHKTKTDVTIGVFTNTAVNLSEGTLVQLTMLSDSTIRFSQQVHDGKVIFNRIPKAEYSLHVEQDGFTPSQIDKLLCNSQDEYYFEVELSLNPKSVYNLGYEQTKEQTDVLVYWNQSVGFTEDMEAMPDFAINPSGQHGWTYIDGDGEETFGVKLLEKNPYPHMYDPKAFIVINPSATNPSILPYVQPHSGTKVLASVGLPSGHQSDDYLISPVLHQVEDFRFSFWACAGFYGLFGEEEFMVGYTLTEDPQPANIVWLTTVPQKVGGNWTQYVYNLPAGAKRAVVRCVSQYKMFFLIDDIEIGTIEPKVFAMTTFDVYVNGQLYGNTVERQMLLKGLPQGSNLVEIQTVYPMVDNTNAYATKEELVLDLKDYTAIQSITQQMPFHYNPNNREIYVDEKISEVRIYDTSGVQVARLTGGQKEALSQGIYLVCIHTSNNQEISSKLIVE